MLLWTFREPAAALHHDIKWRFVLRSRSPNVPPASVGPLFSRGTRAVLIADFEGRRKPETASNVLSCYRIQGWMIPGSTRITGDDFNEPGIFSKSDSTHQKQPRQKWLSGLWQLVSIAYFSPPVDRCCLFRNPAKKHHYYTRAYSHDFPFRPEIKIHIMSITMISDCQITALRIDGRCYFAFCKGRTIATTNSGS